MGGPAREVVERKVYFYRLDEVAEGADRRRFDATEVCELISALSWTEGNRYYDTPEGDRICIWAATTTEHVRLSIGRIRRRDLPMVEESGQLLPLSIGDNQGLAEQTHMVFFGDGIVGTEFNFHGPRVGSFVRYIANKFPDRPPLMPQILLNRDAAGKLDTLEDLRLVRLRLRKDYLNLLEEAGEDVYHGLDATLSDVRGELVEIVLRTAPRSRQSLGDQALALVRRLVNRTTINEGADVFRVKGRNALTDRVETIDLLRDHLVSSRQVARGDSHHRGVDSVSMYNEITAAYDTLRRDITKAASLEEQND